MINLKFYTPGVSNKLNYVLNFIESLYNIHFEIEIKEQKNFSIAFENCTLSIANSGKLFQNKIEAPPITGDPLNLPKSYFRYEETDIKEDFLAGIFFMLSRTEEYQNHHKDEWGRYLPQHSWASQNFVLKTPIADEWMQILVDKINKHLFDKPTIYLHSKYNHIHTIDVDNAYCYLAKGWKKNIYRFMLNGLKFNCQQVYNQSKVLLGKANDPYSSYEYHKAFCEMLEIKPIYFIQMGNYGFPDTNIPVKHPKFKEIIDFLKTFAEIGLHPSFKSNNDFALLKKEKEQLEDIVGKEITKSRQHFLVSDLPITYQNLLNLGIREDYSMGYAQDWGFRAGTTHPFYFFDIMKNKITPLKIYPLGLMDGTLKQYLKLNTSRAELESEEVINIYKKYQGTFVSLWHNHTIGNQLEWKNWQQVFENQMYIANT